MTNKEIEAKFAQIENRLTTLFKAVSEIGAEERAIKDLVFAWIAELKKNQQ